VIPVSRFTLLVNSISGSSNKTNPIPSKHDAKMLGTAATSTSPVTRSKQAASQPPAPLPAPQPNPSPQLAPDPPIFEGPPPLPPYRRHELPKPDYTLEPAGFHDDDPHGVPIFEPTIEEFDDFTEFVRRVEWWGRQRGLVKVSLRASSEPSGWPTTSLRSLRSRRRKNGSMGWIRASTERGCRKCRSRNRLRRISRVGSYDGALTGMCADVCDGRTRRGLSAVEYGEAWG